MSGGGSRMALLAAMAAAGGIGGMGGSAGHSGPSMDVQGRTIVERNVPGGRSGLVEQMMRVAFGGGAGMSVGQPQHSPNGGRRKPRMKGARDRSLRSRSRRRRAAHKAKLRRARG